MAPILNKDGNKPKSWREVNKVRREEKKNRKEKQLLQKKQIEIIKEEIHSEVQYEKLHELSTVSIAVPGSILENAQSAELRTYLAGQIARAACIFQIDEIVVFDDLCDIPATKQSELQTDEGLKRARTSCVQLGRILQYLECPQYLRKDFFQFIKI